METIPSQLFYLLCPPWPQLAEEPSKSSAASSDLATIAVTKVSTKSRMRVKMRSPKPRDDQKKGLELDRGDGIYDATRSQVIPHGGSASEMDEVGRGRGRSTPGDGYDF